MSDFPDLTKIIIEGLKKEQRAPTGLLHCSRHAAQPLRFTQLEMALESAKKDFGELMVLRTGTLFHKDVEHWVVDPEISKLIEPWEALVTELDITHILPQGWTGTLDYLFRNKTTGQFVVGDLKTIKPDGMDYLTPEPKKEHKVQVSCYHAAVSTWERVGPNLHPDIPVYYLPKDKKQNGQVVLPRMTSTKALSRDAIWNRLEYIKARVDEYLEYVKRTGNLINDALEDMPEPELKYFWNREKNVWEVKRLPHWTCRYNDWGPELTPRQSTNLVGYWTVDEYYVPRKGWEFITEVDVPKPPPNEFRRRNA